MQEEKSRFLFDTAPTHAARLATLGASRPVRGTDEAARQALLDELEAKFRPPNFLLPGECEFARFDVCATYLRGDCRLTVQRCAEHIADVRALRAAFAEEGSGAPAVDVPEPCTEADAQKALRHFFRFLFSLS